MLVGESAREGEQKMIVEKRVVKAREVIETTSDESHLLILIGMFTPKGRVTGLR